MKKVFILLLFAIVFSFTIIKAQCPPGAFAYQSLYPQCSTGCGVLLLGWPEGVLVNIYGGAPLRIITSTVVSGTLGHGGTGDAFTCVPCNMPLVYASATPGATSGCVIATIGIVPIKLINFSAVSAGGSTTVKWSVNSEGTPVKYVIQKSKNGRTYNDITTIDGIQRQMINHYTYNDLITEGSTAYYRIKVAEISGNIFYSEAVLVKNESAFGISIYPNPSENEFSISLPAKFLPATIEITNAQGKLIHSEKINGTTSQVNKFLPKGVYAVKITGNNNIAVTERLIKN